MKYSGKLSSVKCFFANWEDTTILRKKLSRDASSYMDDTNHTPKNLWRKPSLTVQKLPPSDESIQKTANIFSL